MSQEGIKKAYPANGRNSPLGIDPFSKISEIFTGPIISHPILFVKNYFCPCDCKSLRLVVCFFQEVIEMIYTPNTKKAMKLCFEAHKDQTDKSGIPYVFHPFHLAEQMETEETTVVALLHDVVEDTDYTLEDLAGMGFGESVMEALALLTHDDAVDYMDYVRAIKANPIATAVKLADLRHNSDLSRMDEVTEKVLERREKYLKAMAFLEE